MDLEWTSSGIVDLWCGSRLHGTSVLPSAFANSLACRDPPTLASVGENRF